jgi:hypothetical protein
VGFGKAKLFSPALEQLYMYPTETATRHRTPSLISNPPQMIPTKLLPLRTMDERRAIHNTFRLRDLTPRTHRGEKSRTWGVNLGEEERREERSSVAFMCVLKTAPQLC